MGEETWPMQTQMVGKSRVYWVHRARKLSTLAWCTILYIIVMGMQVVGRDLAQALQQEFAASQAAAKAPGDVLDTSLQLPPASPASASGRHSRFSAASKLSCKEIQKR